MLFRHGNGDVIAISQPSHAWLSGQLARAWGNEKFAAPSPYEEVCLAAEQHDLAWLAWESAPTLNLATGLPHEFREINVKIRIALWRRGIGLALGFGQYPALLISLHAHTIHAAFARSTASPTSGPAAEDHQNMRDFLDEQQDFRRDLLKALSARPRYHAYSTPEACERNRLLIFAVDRMSLMICWGIRGETIIPDVPVDEHATINLRLRSRTGEFDDLIVDPWPFTTDRCKVICEGCRIADRFDDETMMRSALNDPAARVTIEAELRPG
jgi:hypothetical protein